VQVANEVIQDSGIDIVQFVGGNIGRAIARWSTPTSSPAPAPASPSA
jgi:hypothetical protein